MRGHESSFTCRERQDGCGRTFSCNDAGDSQASQANDRTQCQSDVNAAAARVEPDCPSAATRHFNK